MVTLWSSTIRQSRSGPGVSGVPSYRTMVPPRISVPKMSQGPIIQPMSVNQNMVSSACMSNPWAISWAVLIGKPPWTWTAPLGLPVVPLV